MKGYLGYSNDRTGDRTFTNLGCSMTRKELSAKLGGLPIATYRKSGSVRVEVDTKDAAILAKYPHAGQGKNVGEACEDFLRIAAQREADVKAFDEEAAKVKKSMAFVLSLGNYDGIAILCVSTSQKKIEAFLKEHAAEEFPGDLKFNPVLREFEVAGGDYFYKIEEVELV